MSSEQCRTKPTQHPPRARAAKASAVRATLVRAPHPLPPRGCGSPSASVQLPDAPLPTGVAFHSEAVDGRSLPPAGNHRAACPPTSFSRRFSSPGCGSFHSAQWHPDIWPGSQPHGAPGDRWETQPLIVIAVQTGRGRDTGLSQGALLPVGRCRPVSPSPEKAEQLEARARQGLSRGETHADCSTGQSQRHTGFPLPNIHIPNLLFVFVWVHASCSVMSNSFRPHGLQPARLLCPWNSPGKNTGVDSHRLFQGIFQTQWSNLDLLYWSRILYYLSHQRSPLLFLALIQMWNKKSRFN